MCIRDRVWNQREPCPGCGSRWHRDCRKWGNKGGGGGKQHFFCQGSFFSQQCFLCDRWESIEPTSEKEKRTLLANATRERFGIVVDTAAPDSIVGAPFAQSYTLSLIHI